MSGLAGTLGMFASRMRVIRSGIQYALIITMLTAAMMVTRMFGSLILVPTLMASWVIVVQAHPERHLRVAGLVLGMSAMMLPWLLEMLGLLTSSYGYASGNWFVMPQLTNLPEWFVVGFLGGSNLLIAVLPALFVGRLRGELTKIQQRELVRSWQLRRLGDDLMRAAA
ncbi:MAG: hypothetical protein JWP01_629 [Myxococcales bacterium]|nr:hypothetical protein [Myxococcales bacterium]